jgi:hypothetical protein
LLLTASDWNISARSRPPITTRGWDLAVRALQAAGFAPQGELRTALAVFSYVLGGAFALKSEPSSSELNVSQQSAPTRAHMVDPTRSLTGPNLMEESSIPLASEVWFEGAWTCCLMERGRRWPESHNAENIGRTPDLLRCNGPCLRPDDKAQKRAALDAPERPAFSIL